MVQESFITSDGAKTLELMGFQLPTSTGATVGFLKHQQCFTNLVRFDWNSQGFPETSATFWGAQVVSGRTMIEALGVF